MSIKNVKTKNISWLKLKNTTTTQETEKLFEDSIETRGFIRNMQAVLGQFPAVLLAQDALSRALSRALTVEYEGGLNGKERELIALVVTVAVPAFGGMRRNCGRSSAMHSGLAALK